MRRVEVGRTHALVVAILSAAVLSACGGGGSDGPTATVIPESLSITAPAVADTSGPVQFGNSTGALSGLKYSWDFGDGTSASTEAGPSHSYAKAGEYDVVLRVSNEAGASRETRLRITVNNKSHVKNLVCSGADQSGWCWQQPRPTGSARSDTFFINASTGWTVGELGEIFKTTDSGASWVRQASGVDVTLTHVRFADANNGWALGNYRALLRTSDGGATWRVSSLGTDFYVSDFKLLDAQTLVMRDNANSLRVSSDGGTSWRTLDNYCCSSNQLEIASNKTIWTHRDGVLSKSTDLGATATEVLNVRAAGNSSGTGYSSLSYEMKVIDGSRVLMKRYRYDYVYNTGATTYTTDWWLTQDGGASWTTPAMQGLPSGFTANNSARIVHVGAGGALLMASNNGNGGLYRSADGGNSWTQVTNSAFAYYYVYPENFLKIGENVSMYLSYGAPAISEDGGLTWTTITAPPGVSSAYNLRSAQALDTQTWQVTTSDGLSYRTTDKGKTWKSLAGQSALTSDNQLRAFWAVDAKRLLGINGKSEMVESKDGGLSWQVKLSGLSYAYNPSFQFVSAKAGWLALGDGRLYRSTDGGETWAAGLSSNFNAASFHFVDETNGFAVVNGRLLKSSDGGLGWTDVAALPSNVTRIRFQSASRGLAVGYGGIHETRDGGLTWAPRFTGSITDFASLAYADADNVWAIGSYGAVQSSDGGETWRKVNIGTSASLTAIQFIDAKRGWIAGYNGTVFATTDGGKTWKEQLSGTNRSLRTVQFVDTRTGWILGDSGSLLATGTGGN